MVLALTTDSIRSSALVIAIVLVVVGLLMAVVVQKVIVKVVGLVVMAGLALLVWNQRSSIQNCADKIKGQVLSSKGVTKTQCSFFGVKVDVPGVDKVKS
jgi:hypothetical protein